MRGNAAGAVGKDDSRELLKSILQFMRQSRNLSLPELVNIYSEISPHDTVPLSIFSGVLSPSESLCRYLRDERKLSFHEIALLIGRDDRSVWTSYSRASRKSVGRSRQVPAQHDGLCIPISIFSNRSLSILENLVHHLRSVHGLPNSGISKLLNREHSSIATVAKRARDKVGER
jgi:hypothetical protein